MEKLAPAERAEFSVSERILIQKINHNFTLYNLCIYSKYVQ